MTAAARTPVDPTRTPLQVRCDICQHRWVAAYMPLPLVDCAALLQSLRCPMCAAPSTQIFAVLS